MKLNKMLSLAAIAMFSITPVALAQDSLIVPNGDGTTSTRTVGPLIRGDDEPDDGQGDEKEPQGTSTPEETSSQEETTEATTQSDESTQTSESSPAQVDEVAFTMQNGVKYIDLTCGVGESITDHQEVFGSPGTSCDVAKAQDSNNNDGGGLIIPDGDNTPEEAPKEPEEESDKPDEPKEQSEPDEPEEPKEPQEPQEPDNNAQAPSGNSGGAPRPGGGLIVPDGDTTPDDDNKDDDSKDVDPDDVQKELNNMGDAAEDAMHDYLKASPLVFEEHHDDIVLLMSIIASSEDGMEKIEGLVKDNAMMGEWMNSSAQDITDKIGQDVDEQIHSLHERIESMGIDERDVKDIVESFDSIKSMMGGNND